MQQTEHGKLILVVDGEADFFRIAGIPARDRQYEIISALRRRGAVSREHCGWEIRLVVQLVVQCREWVFTPLFFRSVLLKSFQMRPIGQQIREQLTQTDQYRSNSRYPEMIALQNPPAARERRLFVSEAECESFVVPICFGGIRHELPPSPGRYLILLRQRHNARIKRPWTGRRFVGEL